MLVLDIIRTGCPAHAGKLDSCQDSMDHAKSVQWLKTSEFSGKLEELYHQTLVCDCAPHQLCHADALIAEAATTTIPQVRGTR